MEFKSTQRNNVWKLPKWVKDTNLKNQEGKKILYSMNTKKSIQRHTTVKFILKKWKQEMPNTLPTGKTTQMTEGFSSETMEVRRKR